MKDDYFQAYLVEGAYYTEGWEFPILQPCHEIPEDLIAFSKTKDEKNFNQFVHFYEKDRKILPFGRNPRSYFPRLSQFKGVIGCDISASRDMPFSQQIGQIFWNRALTFWLQNHGIPVVPNIRYGDERSYPIYFDGIPQNSVISIGTHGCIRKKDDISYHIKGVLETIKQLKPEAILFYGAVNEDIKYILNSEKIYYKIFASDTSDFFRKRKDDIFPLFAGMNTGGGA
jgi:hypothetical protein